PVAAFTFDAVRYEGQAVSVDGSGTVEPGDDIVSWQWDWESDGTFDNTTGPASEVIYTKPGYYNITLRVTDGEGSTNETVHMVQILNVVPNAALSISDRTIMEGEETTFDCSGSSEPGDDIIRYYFDFEGDGTYEFNTTEPVVNHSYLSVGVYVVSIAVLDEDMTFDTYSHFWWTRVTVSNAPPLVNASESSGPEGENITITVDVYEPGDNLVDFYWDFDGDYLPDVHTTTPYVNHTFWEAGVHWIWVNVTDEDHTDATPSWGGGEIKVNVSDVAPKPSVENGQATEGEPTPFTVVMKGTEENITTFQFDLDGDGKFEVTSKDWTTMLTFTDTGEIECLIRVVDTDGTENIALFNVYVYDVAPTLKGPAFMLVAEGEDMRVQVTAEEPGMDLVRYEWDWNADGITDDTTTGPEAVHAYTTQGAKRIVVKVVDEDGSEGS
ncbi:MAG: PKD domain-containing protein, partial [Thermoplasmata archaeon]